MNKKKGFTLIELLVVIAIIGILVSISAPKLRRNLAKAQDVRIISLLGSARISNSISRIDYVVSDKEGNPTLLDIKNGLSDRTVDLFGADGELSVGGIEDRNGDYTYGGNVYLSQEVPHETIIQYKENWKGKITSDNQEIYGDEIFLSTHDKEDKSSEGKLWIKY